MKILINKPRVSLGTVGWILLLGFLAYRMAPQARAALGVGDARLTAPVLELPTLAGERLNLEQYREQVVLVNFWATWCPPCRVEMPGFQRVYDDRREEGFVVIGISTDQAGEAVVRAFLDDRDITFPVAMATREVVRDFGGVRALPTSFLIDRDGRVRQEVTGIFLEPALRLAVGHLLQESGAIAPDLGVAQ